MQNRGLTAAIKQELLPAAIKSLTDTGSKLSLLRNSALDDVLPDCPTTLWPMKQKTGLICSTGDHLEITTGCEVPLKSGEFTVTATFFICTEIARFRVVGPIGQNILSGEKVDLLLSRGAISIKDTEIPILNWAGKDNWTSIRKDWHSCEGALMRLAEEVVMPPLSEGVVMGEVTSELAKRQFGVAESNLLEVSDTAGAYGLVRATDSGKVSVLVFNTALQEIKLPVVA